MLAGLGVKISVRRHYYFLKKKIRCVKCEMRECQGSLNFCSSNMESDEECDAYAALIVAAAMM